MRIQILHLDPHDDQASARERLRWARAERIVLVWPGHGRVLGRRLDLLLLQREAARQGARLGVVAHDPDVRENARELRIPIFDDLDSVTADAWPPEAEALPSRPSPPAGRTQITPHDRRRARKKVRPDDPYRAGWILFVIAALLALSIVVGPAAVVEMTPTVVSSVVEVEVVLDELPSGGSAAASIPARRVETEVEGELRLPTEGLVRAPVAAAQGFVVFTNRDQAEAVIPEGTGMRTTGTPSIRFETTERALIPAGIGSQARVPIRASASGTAGNVGAEAITAVEGALGLRLSVGNPEATSGGRVEQRPGVSADDVGRAHAALERRLLQEAHAQMVDSLDTGEALAPESVAIEAVLEKEHRPEVGQPSESVVVSMRLTIGALAFDAVRLEEVASTAIAEDVGPEAVVVPNSIRIELEPVSGTGRYRAVVRSDTVPRIDAGELPALLAGKPVADAAALLSERFGLQTAPRFRLWPDGWPRLPLLPWRIRLTWTISS